MITMGIDANSCVHWTFIFNDEHEALCARAKMLANIEKCEHEVTLHHLIRGIVVKFVPPFKLTDSQIYIFTRAELDTCFEKFELKPGIDPLSKTKFLSVNAPRINYASHPVEIKVQGRTNGKLKIMEDLRMIDFDCWRSSCDERTMGYIANNKTKVHYKPYNRSNLMSITKVIFNPPATIVFWADGCKTVVKCGPDDKFNPHVGIAMCVMKRLYGDKYVNGPNNEKVHAWNFHGIFRKWADPWLKKQEEEAYKPNGIAPDVILKDFSERMNIAFDNCWRNVLKNFESASDDQKAEDDKEK